MTRSLVLRWIGLALLPLACTGVKEHFPAGVKPPPSGEGGAGSPITPPPSGTGGATLPPSGTGGGSPPSGTGGAPPSGTGGAPNPGGTGGSGGGTPPGPTPDGGPSTPVTPPPGGSVIEIGGQMVPSDKVVVFIHVGTSNMAGRANTPRDKALFDYHIWYGKALPNGQPDPSADPNPLPYDPKLWMFNLEGKFLPAREPTASDESDEAGAGPGMGLMRAAIARWPNNYIVSIGRGQSGQRGGYCQHFLERNLITGELWSTTPPPRQNDAPTEKLYGFYNEVINRRALKVKGKVIFGGIVAMFGATEDRVGAPVPSPPAEPYLSQCLIRMAATYRQALGDVNIPFIMTDMERGAGEFTYDGVLGQKVRRQVRLAQTMIPRSDILPTDRIEMQDDHHYNLRGHRTWGELAVEIMVKNGWDTWARR